MSFCLFGFENQNIPQNPGFWWAVQDWMGVDASEAVRVSEVDRSDLLTCDFSKTNPVFRVSTPEPCRIQLCDPPCSLLVSFRYNEEQETNIKERPALASSDFQIAGLSVALPSLKQRLEGIPSLQTTPQAPLT